MELATVMRTTSSCRYFTDEPVGADVLYRVFDNARFASSGGNRQGWRVVVVTDPAIKLELARLHRRQWDPYYQKALEGIVSFQGDSSGARMEHGTPLARRRLDRTDDFAKRLQDVPVLLVCYVELASLAVTDAELGRVPVVGGGSLYTFVQNVLLSCTDEGLGSALTTLVAAEQPAVDEVLGTAEGHALGALVAVGWPDPDRLYTKLRRKPVDEIVFRDRWGDPYVG